ncbi:hypothetical protein [Thalassomonas actiniarum]|uniref:Uncharacterized protein n=1 Tax=Thalassomonas actiniarum TaxID=485447 RepID=A0AAF0C6K1_9GAMM|nr:hypothetical protein [Thalassomonas actiniarum]WDE02371.1 hypothetical protein SG35_028575 [Thalassomonas actiniarum]
MNSDTKKPAGKEKIVRVSKKDKANLEGATSWAVLVAEEQKENSTK